MSDDDAQSFVDDLSALETLFEQAVALEEAGNIDEAAAAYVAYVQQAADEGADPVAHPHIAQALERTGTALVGGQQLELALRCYQRITILYGNNPSRDVSEYTLNALYNTGILQGHLGQSSDALAAFDAICDRFGETEEPTVRRYVAMTLYRKGILLLKLSVDCQDADQFLQALAVFGDAYERFADDSDPVARAHAARSLHCIAAALEGQSDIAKPQLLFNEIIQRYGADLDSDIQSVVSSATRRVLAGLPTTVEPSTIERDSRTIDTPVAKRFLDVLQLWIRAADEQHRAGLGVLKAFLADHAPFGLYLRNFEFEASVKYIESGKDDQLIPVYAFGSQPAEGFLMSWAANQIAIVGLANKDDLHPRERSAAMPKLRVASATWPIAARALIRAATFIVVSLEEITPGVESELGIIAEQLKQDATVILLRDRNEKDSMDSLMTDAITAFHGNAAEPTEHLRRTIDKDSPELRGFTRVFYFDEFDPETLDELLPGRNRISAETNQG